MVARTWHTISEKTFYLALAKAKKLVFEDTTGMTWVENDDYGSEEFCLNGHAYRNSFGTYEKGKVVL